MNNLEIYDKARSVPAEAKKPIGAGRLKGFTDINPMWRIKRLTELFGPCGTGWWYEVTDKRIEYDEITNQKCAFVEINLFYEVDGKVSHPVYGTGGASFVTAERNGPYMSDECFKMALTDAISVAAKNLGIAADVYFEKDRDKYFTPEPEKKPEPKKQEPAPTQNTEKGLKCDGCGKFFTEPTNNSGNIVPLAEWEKMTHLYWAKTLCNDCIASGKFKKVTKIVK